MEDCTSDADEHLYTEDESDTAENESPRGSDYDRPFVEFVTPLGNGTSMTVGDALVLIMDYAIGEGLPWTGIEKLLKLQNLLLGTNSIPESKYLFRKFASASPDDVTFNFYCPTCETLLAKTAGSLKERQGISPTCSVCGVQYLGKDLMSKGCYFVGLPMEKQLASVLADETVREHLAESLANLNTPRPSAKLDLTDGDSYRSQRAKLGCGPHDLTVSMNADGSPIFKSANYAIWPVQLTLNELPPCLRWRSVVLPLLWYGAKHPNMTLLLQAFAAQMKTLAQEGITWSAGGSTLNSKVYCVSCVADAPARAAMQNVMQYNGYYGCSWCLHPGVCINGCVKYPVSAGVMDDRTELGMVADMAEAAASKQAVRGVKGPSPLVNVPGFDISFFFSPERLYREHRDAFELPEEIFRKQYRLPKIVVRWLCDELREEPEVRRVRTSWTVMTVELQVLCALRFYGTGSFQGMVASDEHVARDQKTVSVAVRAVSVAIVRRLGVQRGWIHFPETPSERFDAEKGFRLLGRIPGVIGCVDGTMVSIVGPSKNDPTVTKAAYWCRKYFYALNVMVVCDADCRIMCIDPRYPGSVHDSFVWQFSWLRNQLEQGQLPRDGRFLLGDSGYPLEPWLITPVPGNHATSTACGRFNKAHSSISAPQHLPCIERARTGVRLRP
ncbi:uncharacterized protein ISCGN_014174 [Ixodes scapularis]